jgi:hypothetical protein
MSKSIPAIYDDGVFRPVNPVDLPNHTPVLVIPQPTVGTGEGIRASAGSWGDAGDEFDVWLCKLEQMRHSDQRPLPPAEQSP